MSNTQFRVLITGDTGSDECIFQTERRIDQSDYDQSPADASDSAAQVPAGAAFVKDAFDALFSEPNDERIKITSECAPLSGSRSTSTRIILTQYARPTATKLQRDDPWRIRSRREYRNISKTNITPPAAPALGAISDFDLAIVADCGDTFRKSNFARDQIVPAIKRSIDANVKRIASGDPCHPIACIVDLDGALPAVQQGVMGQSGGGSSPPQSDLPQFIDNFWTTLIESGIANNTCVMCSSRALRHESALIARHSSWELAIETLLAELQLHSQLKGLTAFGHVIIRFGCAAVLHVARTRGSGTRVAQFVFAPCAPDGVYRNAADQGDVVGYKTLIAASIAAGMATNGPPLNFEKIGDCIRTGLFASMRLHDRGYLKVDAESEVGVIGGAFRAVREVVSLTYNRWIKAKNEQFSRAQTLGAVPVPDKLIEKPTSPLAHFGSFGSAQRWEILSDSLNRYDGVASDYPSQEHSVGSLTARINTAMAIALYGHDQVLNRTVEIPPGVEQCFLPGELSPNYRDSHDCVTLEEGTLPALAEATESDGRPPSLADHPIYAPIMEFGELTVIDREELEGICSARNAIRKYSRQNAFSQSSAKPISVAVFGPPGSGKSFVVKQLVRSINESLRGALRRLQAVEFNVSQFKSIGDLEVAATVISNTNHRGATPLVFFDEFDCEFAGQPLGWLRYFLAPMQDGIFYGTKEEVQLGPAVFVFAGGIYHRFDRFVPSLVDLTQGIQAGNSMSLHEFAKCKGPDFVSRLSAHINIPPLDRAAGRNKCVIRRALLLRSIMKKLGLVDGTGASSIDKDIVYALLTIDRYRHGARSMETLLATCIPIKRHIEKASLPTYEQMNMHIDAKELIIRMQRGRVRRLNQTYRASDLPRREGGLGPPRPSLESENEKLGRGKVLDVDTAQKKTV